MYQGHLNDGSSVQKHSAGPLYPLVVYAQDTARGLRYGLITPGESGFLVGSYDRAVGLAIRINALRAKKKAAK